MTELPPAVSSTGPAGADPAFLDTTRAAYDAVAVDYEALLRDQLARGVVDRAVLGAFAESASGPVLDVGCGPGRVTTHLAGLGLDVSGVDLSPGMVAVARTRYPDLRFEVGSMTDLDHPDGGLGGVVAWYSVIHVPPHLHPGVFAGFHRVLRPGGHLLVAFQVGDERRDFTEGYGHEITLSAYRLRPERVAEQLVDAGFEPHSTLVRAPEPPNEKTPQAYLLVRKP
ncbi:class I SAM-dependent DNA methyltransferase [Saccharothrix australiensis]|uniref:Methyltransferase family protein n=1 Tax=Saccharothrix australiensis TaxID=2072 RepID=A0A495VQT0_9PSEU|nr:methyltransferase domain-containing protein [Saccharothrix australiensis]RKT51761.1 methyltransferase family protein [Saccharothrix australiensis]